MVWSLRSDKEKRGDFEKQIAAEENTLLIGSMPSEQGINASSGIVTAGVILLAPEEQVGYLSGIEPAMLAASPPAIDMSETAKMEPEVQVFVADEQARNVSALIGSMPSEQGINASSGIVTAGVILLAPEEQVGYLSGIEPAMLAASPPAIDMSETAKMEPEVQVFVADEQARNVSAGQSMPAAAVPAMTAAERILSMVSQVGNLSNSGQSTPAATVHPKMIAAITADSAGGQGVVILQ